MSPKKEKTRRAAAPHGAALLFRCSSAALAVGALAAVLLVSGERPRANEASFNPTVPLLPAEEMIGRLPIFGILCVLLVHRAGSLGLHLAWGEPRRHPPRR